MSQRSQSGFTLIELMVVIGILVLLLSITVIAINPARQFARANNTKRRNDVGQISAAIYQNIAENHGKFYVSSVPFTLPSVVTAISNTGAANICAGIMPGYIPALPQDPSSNGGALITSCATYATGYTIVKDATTNRITVAAPSAEIGEIVSVTR